MKACTHMCATGVCSEAGVDEDEEPIVLKKRRRNADEEGSTEGDAIRSYRRYVVVLHSSVQCKRSRTVAVSEAALSANVYQKSLIRRFTCLCCVCTGTRWVNT
jgi:hypothetical protein